MSDNHDELSKYAKAEIQKTIDRELRIKQIKEELKQNESVVAYFSNYMAGVKESFIDSYAHLKSSWIEWGPMYAKLNLDKDSRWIDEAWKCLEIIQQKKLFDAQCLWRAEKVKFKEVEICFDFQVWEHDVLNCPFIEPINEDDINLYAKFLLSLNSETQIGFFDNWQDYEELKEAYQSEGSDRNFPEWYDFFNTYRGTSAYLLLPDIRGEKEDFYRKAVHKKQEEIKLKENPNPNPPQHDARPFISPHNKAQLIEFITLFENREILQLYKEHERGTSKGNYYEFDFDELMHDIGQIDESFPIEAHHDYKMALYFAYEKYTRQKIAEALPMALEQYSMNFSLQITQPGDTKFYGDLREKWADAILRGRELEGEEANFDF